MKPNKIFGMDWEEIQAKQMGTFKPKLVKRQPGKDYGSDPIGNGLVKLVPSGRIVTVQEARQLLDS